jgi:hypothetical protein
MLPSSVLAFSDCVPTTSSRLLPLPIVCGQLRTLSAVLLAAELVESYTIGGASSSVVETAADDHALSF